eukprot:scaffold13898_cov30-Tisochrysis_lutea.AAC.10
MRRRSCSSDWDGSLLAAFRSRSSRHVEEFFVAMWLICRTQLGKNKVNRRVARHTGHEAAKLSLRLP